MNAPWKPRVAAGIAAGILTLSSLVFAPFVVVRAQTPGTPAAGHASATACASMANRMDMGATPYGSPPAMIATPDAGRQTQVAANGGQVMPFDLNRTTHTFTDLPDGGRETVTANDPGDAEQIALVRAHLQAEARKFTAGDFSDPANIHGCDMPGLAQLQAGFAGIEFRYTELPNGAVITYRSANPALISALHVWFAAQRSDHGSHQTAP